MTITYPSIARIDELQQLDVHVVDPVDELVDVLRVVAASLLGVRGITVDARLLIEVAQSGSFAGQSFDQHHLLLVHGTVNNKSHFVNIVSALSLAQGNGNNVPLDVGCVFAIVVLNSAICEYLREVDGVYNLIGKEHDGRQVVLSILLRDL